MGRRQDTDPAQPYSQPDELADGGADAYSRPFTDAGPKPHRRANNPRTDKFIIKHRSK